MFDRLRVGLMETSATLTASGQTVALPADFLQMRRLLLPADGSAVEIAPMASAAFWGRYPYTSTGRPGHFVIEGTNISFGPSPDSAYGLRLLYYAKPTSVTAGGTTMLAAFPDLFLYGALSHSAVFIGDDERLPLWRAAYEQALARVEIAEERRRLGSTPLQMRAG